MPSPQTSGRARVVSATVRVPAPRTRSAMLVCASARLVASASPARMVSGRSMALLVEQVEEELLHSRTLALAEPEDSLLAELRILLGASDLEQLVRRFRLAGLRVHEQHLVLHLGLAGELLVQRQQLLQLHAALAGVEERLLPGLDLLILVARHTEEPGRTVGGLLVGDRLDHRLPQLGTGRLPEEA